MATPAGDECDKHVASDTNAPAAKKAHLQLSILALNSFLLVASAALTFGAMDIQLNSLTDPVTSGLIKSFTATIGLVVSVPLGRLADMTGPGSRWRLVVFWMAICTMGFVIGAVTGSTSLWTVVLMKIVFTFAGQWEEVSKACIADMTPSFSQERDMWMARFYGGLGAGIYVGPQLSRRLSAWYSFDYVSLMRTAAALQGLCVIAGVAMFSPMRQGALTIASASTTMNDCDSPHESKEHDHKANFSAAIQVIRHSSALRQLLLLRALWVFQFGLVTSQLGLFLLQGLGLDKDALEWFFSYMGLSFALFQAFLVPLVASLGLKTVATLLISQTIEATGRLLTIYLSSTCEGCLAGYIYYLVGTSLFVPLHSGLLSSYAPKDVTSAIMGVSKGLGSLADVVSPTLGGWLFQNYGPFAPLYGATVLLILGYIPIIMFALDPAPKLKED